MNCVVCGTEHVVISKHKTGCPRCWRFYYMLRGAKFKGKSIPTIGQLHELVESLDDFKCPHCDRVMVWLSKDGASTVITLQHYRTGEFGLICRACNTQHAKMPEDMFLSLSNDEKWCPRCSTVKKKSEFYADRSVASQLKAYCKPCSHQQVTIWRHSREFS